MKTFLILVSCLSLVANGVLGYAYWHGASRDRLDSAADGSRRSGGKSSGNAPGASFDPSPADGSAARTGGSADAANAINLAVIDPQLAAALKTNEPHELYAALRQAGFPDKYVRNIMIWQLGEITHDKKLALLREAAERPFWLAGSATDNATLDRAIDALDAKNLDITKEVFGGKVPPLGATTEDQRRYIFLPPDKAIAVYELVTDSRTNSPAGSPGLDSQPDLQAELAKILTPAELEQYNLYLSPTAQILRSQMQAFAPTEQEFRAMYDARTTAQTPSSPAERQASEATLNDKYRSILGEERFAEFQRAQNRDYRSAFQVVQHYQLPVENAAEVYNLRQSATQRLQEIRRNPDPNAVRADTQALTQEVDARLTQLLGVQGADAYAKMGGATWAGAPPGAIRIQPAP